MSIERNNSEELFDGIGSRTYFSYTVDDYIRRGHTRRLLSIFVWTLAYLLKLAVIVFLLVYGVSSIRDIGFAVNSFIVAALILVVLPIFIYALPHDILSIIWMVSNFSEKSAKKSKLKVTRSTSKSSRKYK